MVTGDVPCDQVRLELGVYLLGAIEPARRGVVNRHLAACHSCRLELCDLAGLPSLLRRVPADVVQRLVSVLALQDATAHPPAVVAPERAITAQAANPVGAWAAVRYSARPWGTQLEISITGVATGTRCQLLVTAQDGQEFSAGGWDLAAGQQPTWYPASVPIQAASLRRFAIIGEGTILVTVPAR